MAVAASSLRVVASCSSRTARHVITCTCYVGGGRCNVMHNPMKGASSIAKGYPRGSKELIGKVSKHDKVTM